MNVKCIKCGGDGAEHVVCVDVATGVIRCCACSVEYTAADVREVVDGWLRYLPWLEAHPGAGTSPPPAASPAAAAA